ALRAVAPVRSGVRLGEPIGDLAEVGLNFVHDPLPRLGWSAAGAENAELGPRRGRERSDKQHSNYGARHGSISILASAAVADAAEVGADDLLVARHVAFPREGVHFLALAGGEVAPDVELFIEDGLARFLIVVVALDSAGALAAAFFILGVALAAAFALVVFFLEI